MPSLYAHGFAFILVGAFAPIFSAHAQSLTGNVGSANISDGKQGAEMRLGFDDTGAAAGRFHYDNAFSDWYKLRLIGAGSRPDGGSWDYSGFTIENWFQWREENADQSGFNGGVRFAYGISDEGPDEAELRVTVTDKFADSWEWRANLIGELEVGPEREDGISIEARAQLSRALDISAPGSANARLGFEVFSEFGNSRDIPDFDEQAHQIGPVVKLSWQNGVYLQSAVRVGITEGADDTMLKLFIGRNF